MCILSVGGAFGRSTVYWFQHEGCWVRDKYAKHLVVLYMYSVCTRIVHVQESCMYKHIKSQYTLCLCSWLSLAQITFKKHLSKKHLSFSCTVPVQCMYKNHVCMNI